MGLIIFIVGWLIMWYPIFILLREAKKNSNAIVEDILKEHKYSDKKLFIGCVLQIIGVAMVFIANLQ